MKYFGWIFLFLSFHLLHADFSYTQASEKLERLIEDVEQGKISIPDALLQIDEADIEVLVKPSAMPSEYDVSLISGLCACSGSVSGIACFDKEKLADFKERFGSVIWVTNNISNDELCLMQYVDGVCSFKEDPSSHAIIVLRVHDIPCLTLIEGASLTSDEILTHERIIKEGDYITLDAFNGHIYPDEVPIMYPSNEKVLNTIMEWSDQYAKLAVHANADTATEAEIALLKGAKGLDPRSEHMFFHPDSLKLFRKVILQKENNLDALVELKELQKKTIVHLYQTMKNYPVKLRLLDPPLHEFLPKDVAKCQDLADELGMSLEDLQQKVDELSEDNPMMGHRGVRLLLTFPEILETQARAIFEAAIDPSLDNVGIEPIIIVPMVVNEFEVIQVNKVLKNICEQVIAESGKNIQYKLGVMIETPRACLLADKIAQFVDYFSFGTNDLTGLTFAFSRGDVFDKFLKHYLNADLLPSNPFAELDPAVIKLMGITVENARRSDHHVSIGICGEQASEKSGVFMCHKLGFNSVSCAPGRIPVVRLFTAQAAILYPNVK